MKVIWTEQAWERLLEIAERVNDFETLPVRI